MKREPYRVVLITVAEERKGRSINLLCHKTHTIYIYWYRGVSAAEVAGAIADAARAEVADRHGLPYRAATDCEERAPCPRRVIR